MKSEIIAIAFMLGGLIGTAFGYVLCLDDKEKSDKQPEFPKKEE